MSETILFREFGDWVFSGLQSFCSFINEVYSHPAVIAFHWFGVLPSLFFFCCGCIAEKHGIKSNWFYIICGLMVVLSLLFGFVYMVWRLDYGS